MKTDTLTCRYQMRATQEAFHHVLFNEQKKYFEANHAIGNFAEGCQVHINMQTKTSPKVVPAVITIKKITLNEFWTSTAYEEGIIEQRYIYTMQRNGKLLVTYSEQSRFNKAQSTYSYMVAALVYKFFFNRGVKKRLRHLELNCTHG
ncbi:hypothetical protein [Enterococcus sp. RIT-PI-f]|uniref:hypothetical protein n=1 Tax=Enterococcus sp. RIT-PI-f TaxID=1690244 RepID=UPI0006B9D25A|nr:hypothetical protein [Enterococcus sp. RIT-PI-f]KPG71531.1 hypothetical protein AEQ18_05025 [Enterococcus sp. RIT-PI-f]